MMPQLQSLLQAVPLEPDVNVFMFYPASLWFVRPYPPDSDQACTPYASARDVTQGLNQFPILL